MKKCPFEWTLGVIGLRLTSPAKKDKLRIELLEIEYKLNESRKKTRLQEEARAVNSIKRNSKYAKRFSKTFNQIGPLKDKSGNFIYENQKIANLLSDQYKSVFSKPETHLPPVNQLFPDNCSADKLTDIPYTINDLIAAIDELSNTAASGPDYVAAILLKNTKHELAPALYVLWRKCLDEGITPYKLKQPEIVPIYKGGSMAIPANFRPVSLTSHLIKIFEKVIKKYPVNYLEDHNLFNANQHGFRKGRSCLSQLLVHYEQILSALENDKDVDVVYLDFSKAFDKVDFEVLLKKIKQLASEVKSDIGYIRSLHKDSK